ncbi:MAG: tRNA pseudouridine(55) synthase TruB [Phycisphaerae bacterium]
MDGLLNLYKPVGITSAKALYRVRRLIEQRKSGHAGTLDPAAEGVLVLCLGRATKLVERIMSLPKRYLAQARLDVTSASFDSDRPLVPVPVATPPTMAEVRAALSRFQGVIQQTPPVVSAIKVGGRPAYRLERAGKPPVLSPRPARVDHIKLLQYEWPRIEFEVACGRGFYVRALIRDIGAALNTGGCLTRLVRTAIGPFEIASAWRLEALTESDAPGKAVIPIQAAIEMFERDAGI